MIAARPSKIKTVAAKEGTRTVAMPVAIILAVNRGCRKGKK